MRIGFDVSQTGRFKTGCGYFADALVRALVGLDHANTYILYPTFGSYWDHEWQRTTLQLADKPNVRRAHGQRRLDQLEDFWLHPPADQEAQLGSPDVVHSNNFFCPTTLPRARLVYTLHDLAFVDHPEWTDEANWRVCFDGVFHASVYADRIVAVSDYTRRRFLELFPHVPHERVSVVYEASRFTDRSANGGRPQHVAHLRPGEFWLASGDPGPRKNLARLLDAYSRFRAHGETDFPLVLFGGVRSGQQAGVEQLGYVDDATLQWLYEHCIAFCYPSLYEGFGLPVIEAMSLGAPVLTSQTTSLPEVVGDSALTFDPSSVEAIYAGMRHLAQDAVERDRLRCAGLARSHEFSWQKAARQVLDIYQALVTEYPRSSQNRSWRKSVGSVDRT